VSQDLDRTVLSRHEGLTIRDSEFQDIRRYLYELSGIALGEGKQDMVFARLAKRIRSHNFSSFGEYLQFLKKSTSSGTEQQEFINCLTTNKTDFFRERHHFDFLRDTLVPRWREREENRVRIWSAGCSTGEEPYTLAMTLREHLRVCDGWDTRILASDIDTAVLAAAEKGIYDADRVGDVPENLRRKYFLRGTGTNLEKVAIRPELRESITFRQINLMDEEWPVRTRFDAIFCRNVVIYFDRDTQHRLLEHFASYLKPEGYLFLGHSENIHWMAHRFTSVGRTVYRLRGASEARPSPPRAKPSTARPQSPPPAPAAEIPLPEQSIILGEVKTAQGPAILKTLLGSCVSACIFDPEARVGGMNHFSLPGVSDEGVSARYGAHAMEMLITGIMKNGGSRQRLRAKVFGGAKVLKVDSERLNVGARNAEFVLRFLDSERIPIHGQCLGGTRGMVVRFRPDTGQAFAKPLTPCDLTDIVRAEEKFGHELVEKVKQPDDDAITLF
jgi:chemotaxis protein methyltransferase CheR